MKSRKAAPMRPCTASASALQRPRQGAAEEAPRARRRSPGSAPTAASSPRGCPRRRRSCRSPGSALCEFSATLRTEKSDDEMRVDERGEGERETARTASAPRFVRPPSGRRRRRARPRTARSSARARRRARATSAKCPISTITCASRPFLPAALLLQRVDDFARHVALVVLGEDRGRPRRGRERRARPRRRRPGPRGTGPGCWRSTRPGNRRRRSSSRRSRRRSSLSSGS